MNFPYIKHNILLLLIIFCCTTASVVKAGAHDSSVQRWRSIAKAVTCRLAPIDHQRPSLKPIRILVHCQTTAKSPVRVPWDDDFARLLWSGEFLLKVSTNNETRDSRLLITSSNVYPPRFSRILQQGTELSAKIDLSKLPAKLLKNIFPKEGTVLIQLLVPENNGYRPVSSTTRFRINTH